jgi:hypothetical protein
VDPMTRLGIELVAHATAEWTGWGFVPYPTRDESRLQKRYGPTLASELIPILRELEKDFYTSMAHNTVRDLDEMAAQAAKEFRVRHPELPSDIAEAFAWCYGYDWK